MVYPSLPNLPTQQRPSLPGSPPDCFGPHLLASPVPWQGHPGRPVHDAPAPRRAFPRRTQASSSPSQCGLEEFQRGEGRASAGGCCRQAGALQGDMKPLTHPPQRNPRPLLNLSAPTGLNPVHSFGQHGPGISGFARLSTGHWGQREVQTSPVCEKHPVQCVYRPIITAIRRQQIRNGGTVQTQRPGTRPSEAHQQPPREQTLWPLILCGPPLCSPVGRTPRHPSKPSAHITGSEHPGKQHPPHKQSSPLLVGHPGG